MYDLDYDLLCTLATRILVNTGIKTLEDVFCELLPLKMAFPTPKLFRYHCVST